jgi:ribosomal protein S20
MANTKSAQKALRGSAAKKEVNNSRRNRIRTFVRKVDDAVKVTNNKSIYKDKHGIIKKICKNILFLWDKSFMNISNGIFVEQSGNVTLKGYEFL